MSIKKFQDMIPEVYTNTSRDFQLLTRLYDIIIDGVKFDSDSIIRLINTNTCNSKILELLQTKLGFITSEHYTNEEIRYVLKSFPIIIKNKGSLKGIKQAVTVFSKLNKIKSNVSINIINKSNDYEKSYIIDVNLHSQNLDTSLLDEIFKYILPTGSIVKYNFYSTSLQNKSNYALHTYTNIIVLDDSVNSLIRGSYIQYRNPCEYDLIGSIGLTQLSTEYNLEYRGSITDFNDLPKFITEDMLGYVYIYVESTQDGAINTNRLRAYVCDYNDEGDLDWCLFSLQDGTLDESKYNVYSEVIYGYYDSNTTSFFKEKYPESYILDDEFNQDGLRIDSIDDTSEVSPDNCILFNSDNVSLHDTVNDVYYIFNNINNTWISFEINEDSLEVYRHPESTNGTGLAPKENLVATNCTYDAMSDSLIPVDSSTTPAIWISEYINNEYVWSSVILDTLKIKNILENENFRKVLIMHSIEDAYVMPVAGLTIYTKDDKNIWVSNGFNWNSSVINNPISIIGNPNDALHIKPVENQHIYYIDDLDSSNNKSWSFLPAKYVDKISNLKQDILYIDSDTSCAYNSDLTEVVHYVQAGDVYNVDYKTLLFMLENRVIKPAFKNETIIFEDAHNNMLLL